MSALLEITCDGARLGATLDPGGPGPHELRRGEREVDLQRLRELADDIARVLHRGSAWTDRDQGSQPLLARKGAALFDALLPAPVKAVLRSLAGGELVVRASPALAFVPWELLHSGFGFIGLTFAIGRDVPRSTRPPIEGRPWRVLVIADPRGDLIGSYYEGLTLRDELDRAARLAVDLRSSEVGLEDVRQLLRDYDIVHYAGHAEPEVPGGERGWWLRDGILTPSAIAELGGGPQFPRMVFVNACRSARVEAMSETRTSSVAEAFVAAGSEHAVGTVWDVPDEPASGFALAFYAALVSGVPIGEAMRSARLTLAKRYGERSIFWAAWVLHGDPATRLAGEVRAATSAREDGATALAPRTAVAAKVRGAALTDGATPIALATAKARLEWLRGVAIALCLAAIVALAATLGPQGTSIVGRPARTSELGPIERVPALPLELATSPDRDLGLTVRAARAGPEVRVVTSGETYRVRWVAPRDGLTMVWRVDAAHRARRLPTAPGNGEATFTVDGPRGGEQVIVAWRAELDDRLGFEADVELALAEAGHAEAAANAVREVFEDRFDRVQVVALEHR